MEDIKKVLKKQNKTYRILLISLSTILWAILYNLFLLPMKLVTGGTNGVATITNYLYGIDPALMILLLAIACAIISFMYLGFERTATSLVATIAYPVLVKLTANITDIIVIDYSDFLLLVIFAAVLCGVANGLMYKSGYNNGGFPVVSQILYDKYKISVAKSSLVINVIIVLIGAFFFGTTNALYALRIKYYLVFLIIKLSTL